MTNKLFVYGILKQGFGADLSGPYGDGRATFLSKAELPNAQLYSIGGGVGLRFEETEQPAQGELFEILTPSMWRDLDWLEGNGYVYTRKVVTVSTLQGPVEAYVYEHTYPGMTYTDKLVPNYFK